MAIKLKTNFDNKNLTIQQAFDKFIITCKTKNLSIPTIEGYENAYKYFTDYIDSNNLIKDVNEDVIQDYILYLQNKNNEYSQVTIETYVRNLRVFIKYCIKNKFMEYFEVPVPKADKVDKIPYTNYELEILMKKPNLKTTNFVEFRNWVIICFYLGTGVRAGTLCNIKIKDLDFQNNLIHFTKTKTRKSYTIRMTPEIKKLLLDYLNEVSIDFDSENYLFPSYYGKQLTVGALGHSINKYNKKRGVTKTSSHLFRHTFGTDLAINGASSKEIQILLGHATEYMANNYIHATGKDLSERVDRFNPLAKRKELVFGKRGITLKKN